MNRKTFYLIIGIFILVLPQSINAQKATLKPSFEVIIDSVNQKDLNIDERYKFCLKIAHLPVQKQIVIEKMIAKYAQKEPDKAKFITLNCMMFNQYNNLGIGDSAKYYIDIAAQYKEQTSDVNALGALYYQTGVYYDGLSDQAAHENYYKAIDYYKQSKTKKFFLNFLYYKLAYTYIKKEDVQSLSKLVKEMLTVKFDDPYKIYYDNVYSLVASYYQIRAKKEPENYRTNMKKAIYYLNRSIAIYEKYKDEAPNPVTAKRMASQNHWTIANIYMEIEPDNMKAILDHFKKGEAYLDKDHPDSAIKYKLIKASIDLKLKKIQDVINELKAEEKYQKKHELPNEVSYSSFFSIYEKLAQAYEQSGNYKEALTYERLKAGIKGKINDDKKYRAIKELNIKHQTAEKELELSKINKEYQAVQYKRILSVIGFLFLTAFLVALVLYERTKKLQKSKEGLLMKERIKEKDLEYQTFFNETKHRLIRNYLDGLETERIRFARELHDNISNRLVTLKMNIEQKRELQSVATSIGELHMEIRSISHGLMPPVFQYATLSEIIKDYVQQQNQKGNILFTASIIPEEYNWDTISSGLSIEIYRIIQEATGNAIKHAASTQIIIALSIADGILAAAISDNGKGFIMKEQRNGLGLRIIKERAEAINAELNIYSEVNKGTTVHLQVKL